MLKFKNDNKIVKNNLRSNMLEPWLPAKIWLPQYFQLA